MEMFDWKSIFNLSINTLSQVGIVKQLDFVTIIMVSVKEF